MRAALEVLAGRDPAMAAKKRATRARILKSASALFCACGVRQTSMEDIAREAGISRGTLYTYAARKEELARTLAELLVDGLAPTP